MLVVSNSQYRQMTLPTTNNNQLTTVFPSLLPTSNYQLTTTKKATQLRVAFFYSGTREGVGMFLYIGNEIFPP
jgi:hypothetical protein